MKKSLIYNLLMALGAVVIITYFYPRVDPTDFKAETGKPWGYAKLIAPFDIPINPSAERMQAVEDSLERSFVPIFVRDADMPEPIITTLVAQWGQDDNPSAFEKEMRDRTIKYIKDTYLRNEVITNDFMEQVRQGMLPMVRVVSGREVSKEPTHTGSFISIRQVADNMPKSLSADTSAARQWMRQNGIEELLQPNLDYDLEATNIRRDEERNELSFKMGAVVSGVIMKGETVIERGQVISEQDYTNLMTYRQMLIDEQSKASHSSLLLWVGQGLYVILIITALLCYINFTAADVWEDWRKMLFIMLGITLMFVVAIVLNDHISYGAFIAPYALITVLMTVFYSVPLSLFASMMLILLAAGAVDQPLELMAIETMAVVGAAYSQRELTKRSQMLRTGAFVLAASLLAYVAVEFMRNGSTVGLSWRMLWYLTASALLTMPAYILMVAIERAFGFVSVVTLVELTDTNNPVLRELSQECPGTFQHAMAVSNLATDAALRIGANEPLVRAGALYHDIGKLSNPNFFTENQNGVNPHDALPPEQSARVIIGHVTDGLHRANKIGLPQVVKDFILQHHGRGQAKYFYFNACKANPGVEIDPAPYTYPGPNPQTRETSLLMMADSVEAASRSLPEHTTEAITALVNKIIDGQIADGLHSESTLEFRDVPLIKAAFIKRLSTIYHARVKYPDKPKS